jgi:hypothetical protein
MMLVTRKVEIELKNRVKYYEQKGYIIPKIKNSQGRLVMVPNTKIQVDISDIPLNSHIDVMMSCDLCGNLKTIPYREYIKNYKNKTYICKECNHELKFEEGKRKFKELNYELLSNINDYENCFSSLKYICKKHYEKGIKTITLAQINKGSGCKECGVESASIKNRKPFKETINMFKDKGLILLTKEDEYVNGDQLLEFICEKHMDIGIQTIRPRAIYDNQGCKYCGYEKISEDLRLDYTFVKNKFLEKNLILLTDEHIHTDILVPYICNIHNHEIKYIRPRAVINEGQGCPECGLERRSGENSHLWKGGISNLTDYMRNKLNKWKFDSLKFYDFKCCITGLNDATLVVHHLYSYTKILQETLLILNIDLRGDISNYSEQELELISNKFVELNYQKGLGKPMLKVLHDLFHSQNGKMIIDNGEFEEFKINYNNGLYNNIINKVI